MSSIINTLILAALFVVIIIIIKIYLNRRK
jgi:preprotein translocase subunit SecG